MRRAAIYARISQADPNTPAVEKQIEACRKIADDAGYKVEAVYQDDGVSAYGGKTRPGFLDLLTGIEAGRFDVIMAVAEDRFTRSTSEKLAFSALCTKAGATWHTKATGVLDPSTAEGGLLATLTGALAEFESAIKAERIRRSVADRLAAGKDLGGPRPFGYEKDRLTIREDEAQHVREAYAAILDGASVRSIARNWTELGVPRDRGADTGSPWRTKTIHNILLRERNAGRLVVNGVTYAEDRPAIIDVQTFESVRAILKNPGRAPRRGPEPVTYPGLQAVICGTCGNALSISKSGNVSSYRCHPEGRPDWSKDMIHPSMRVAPFDVHLGGKVFYAVSMHAMTRLPPLSAVDGIRKMRENIAELVRKKKIAQLGMTAEGADVALALQQLATFSKAIEAQERALDAVLAKDVAGAAIEAAVEALSGVQTINGLPPGEEPIEWRNHWAGLSAVDKRTLTKALLPGARLLRPAAAQKGENGFVHNRIARGTSKPLKPSPLL